MANFGPPKPSAPYTPAYAYADTTSVVVIISTLADYLPPIAAIISIIWMLIRTYETCTVQNWIRKWRGLPLRECSPGD